MAWPQSRESRKIFGETETTKMAPRRDQSRGLESWLQPLVQTYVVCMIVHMYNVYKNNYLLKNLFPQIFDIRNFA